MITVVVVVVMTGPWEAPGCCGHSIGRRKLPTSPWLRSYSEERGKGREEGRLGTPDLRCTFGTGQEAAATLQGGTARHMHTCPKF